MKYFSFIALSIALISLSTASCERHSFEETKRLHLDGAPQEKAEEVEAAKDKAEAKEATAAEKKAEESAPKEEPRKTGI